MGFLWVAVENGDGVSCARQLNRLASPNKPMAKSCGGRRQTLTLGRSSGEELTWWTADTDAVEEVLHLRQARAQLLGIRHGCTWQGRPLCRRPVRLRIDRPRVRPSPAAADGQERRLLPPARRQRRAGGWAAAASRWGRVKEAAGRVGRVHFGAFDWRSN
jgi:hypothetical protein